MPAWSIAKRCVDCGLVEIKVVGRGSITRGREDVVTVEWQKDIDRGLKQAQASGRAVLLDFLPPQCEAHALGWMPRYTRTSA